MLLPQSLRKLFQSLLRSAGPDVPAKEPGQSHLKDPYAKREAEKYERPIPSRELIEEIYVWRLPVRVYHWINALCMVALDQKSSW